MLTLKPRTQKKQLHINKIYIYIERPFHSII
jgi:hypothetical protein